MRKTTLALLAAAALSGAAATAKADNILLNFDGPGSVATDFSTINFTFGYGSFSPEVDEFGDTIPGSERWVLAPVEDFGIVPVIDPSSVGWGAAPSPSKALDARDGTVLMIFTTPQSFASFSVTLDNSGFGDLSDSPILFFDENNNLLFSASVDQTIAGLTVSTGALSNVKTVVLPGNAFYDNVTVQAVPEPGTCALIGLGVAATLLRFRRKK